MAISRVGKLKCLRNRKDCECTSQFPYDKGGYFCSGYVKNPTSDNKEIPDFDVIRFCTEKDIWNFAPDEASVIIDCLNSALMLFFEKFKP